MRVKRSVVQTAPETLIQSVWMSTQTNTQTRTRCLAGMEKRGCLLYFHNSFIRQLLYRSNCLRRTICEVISASAVKDFSQLLLPARLTALGPVILVK